MSHGGATDGLRSLSAAKRAALEKLLLSRRGAAAQADRIPQAPPERAAELSFAERRLWLLDQFEPNHPFYNMPLAARVSGPLDRDAFAASLSSLCARHQPLRYAYHVRAGSPERTTRDRVEVAPVFVDAAGLRGDDAALHQRLRQEARVPFDLGKAPLLRCLVFELSERERVVLLVMHHIISDGWSMWVMLNDLAAGYDAACGAGPPLEPLPIQYSDYAAWQHDSLSAERRSSLIDHWKSTLADAPPMLALPLDRPRQAIQDFDGAVQDFRLPAGLTPLLRAAADRRQATPFMVLMAAYQAWLSRYTGQADLLVGTVVANRGRSELERLIGFFVNTLAIRGDLSDDPSFDQLVERTRSAALDAYAHQDLPFDQLIEAIAPDRDQSHAALFQTALVVQNPPRDFAAGTGLSIEPMLVDNGTAKYDLTLFFWEDADGWAGQIEYRTSLFEAATIERFCASFLTLLQDALDSPEKPVGVLELLDDAQQRLIDSWNQTQAPLPEPLLAHRLLEAAAAASESNAALRWAGASVTHPELVERVHTAAAGLAAKGVTRGDAVLVALPRSADSVTAMLAVMAAGGVYVPVDPLSGPQRLALVAADTGAKIAIAERAFAAPASLATFDVNELLSTGVGRGLDDPGLKPTDLAYIIYTSGSTGTPKGVQVEHRSFVNFMRAQIDRLGVTSADRVLHAFSPTFDGGLSEAFLSLATGATMVIASRDEVLDPSALTRLLRDESVTIAKFPPALLGTLNPASLPGLRTVSTGGDTLTTELARKWLPGRRMLNGYGPTEATVGVTMYDLSEPLTGLPPIGAPMANMTAYVLDKNLRQTPIGVAGEVYIGGVGVARGYLNRPDETAARFLPDPFVPGGRVYRTGDVARWRADGELEFLGRVDDQVQLRGYRVEPGEVAAALERLPQVEQAYAAVLTDARGEQRLVAYVTPARSEEGHANSEAGHVQAWQSLMDGSHRAAGALRDTGFDTTGWISTYTGQPIPKDEMRRWAECAAQRVLALKPRNVLEIGCGTGLILLRAAPHCESYLGTDFLRRSLDQLQQVVDQRGLAARVELRQLTADQVGQIEGRRFDTVVLNSVAQYFPSSDYLLRVIRQASRLIEPGGRVFLGDLRNLRLHEAFAASVEIARADQRVTRRELLGRIEARLRREEELLVDPDYFEALRSVLPELADVAINIKPGDDANELTRYRYDVTLTFGEPVNSAPPAQVLSAASFEAIDRVESALREQPGSLRVVAALNTRIADDYQAWLRLQDNDGDPAVETSPAAIDAPTPDQWRELAQRLGYQVEIRWGAVPDELEVTYFRGSRPAREQQRRREVGEYTNQPMQQKLLARLAPELRAGLAAVLPQYMLPSAYVVLEEFPRTANGKIDRDALPAPPSGRPAWATGYVAPRDEHERLVAEVWEQLLGFAPVGAEDDFFQLGGHSMLAVQVMSEIENRSGHALPLAALFQEPTVENLARLLRNPRAAAEALTLIPLQAAGDEPPLFCVHPAGGAVFCYQELAAHFSGRRPVIGVQAHGVDGRLAPHESMDQMAQAYADAIHALRPEGPYHVCGWSIGGNIAYEVARRIAADGGLVGLVGLFDAGAMPPDDAFGEEDLLPLLQALFPDAEHASLEEIRGLSADEQVAFFTDRAAKAGLVDPAQLAASRHIFSVFQNNVSAVHKHRPQPFAGEVTLFRAAQQTKTNQLFDDPQLGWGPLVEKVAVLEVPSDHTQMMTAPQVHALAELLSGELARVEAVLAASCP